jgi:hypothetical protein
MIINWSTLQYLLRWTFNYRVTTERLGVLLRRGHYGTMECNSLSHRDRQMDTRGWGGASQAGGSPTTRMRSHVRIFFLFGESMKESTA